MTKNSEVINLTFFNNDSLRLFRTEAVNILEQYSESNDLLNKIYKKALRNMVNGINDVLAMSYDINSEEDGI